MKIQKVLDNCIHRHVPISGCLLQASVGAIASTTDAREEAGLDPAATEEGGSQEKTMKKFSGTTKPSKTVSRCWSLVARIRAFFLRATRNQQRATNFTHSPPVLRICAPPQLW